MKSVTRNQITIPDEVLETICKMQIIIQEGLDKINRLQTFKDCAVCFLDDCANKAEHSDGHKLWCSDCWNSIEEVA